MPDEGESQNHEGSSQPSPEAIRKQLARLLGSQQLQASASLVRFLRFTVEESIGGRGDRLKEYLIGVDVFQRGADFDPRIDPIVRVQARKLRERLAGYYAGPGKNDPVVIELPKGGYAPVFLVRPVSPDEAAAPVRNPTPVPKPQRSFPPLVYGFGAVVLTAGVWVILAHRNPLIVPVEHSMDMAQLTFDNGSAHPAVSRDGKWLVYESDQGTRGDSDIWVRPLKGGSPVPISTHESADTTPDISPDGTLVVFRSNRDAGGIFTIPLTGGEVRRIAGNGYSPRFSPNGAWVAFTAQNDIGVAPATGGVTRFLHVGVPGASFPLWSVDGKFLLFLGRVQPDRFDWWTVPFDPRSPQPARAEPTGLADILRNQRLPELVEHTSPGDWYEDGVLTSLKGSLWKIPFSLPARKVQGKPVQILPGPGVEFARVVPPAGEPLRILFTVRNENVHVWGLAPGKQPAGGSLTQLTRDISLRGGFDGTRPALSVDGNTLVYASGVSGNLDIWKKDLRTGKESPIAANPLSEDRPVLSRDGRLVAYVVTEGGRQSVHTSDMDGNNHRRICEACGRPLDFSPDGRLLMSDPATATSLSLAALDGGHRTELRLESGIAVLEASFSPDGRRLGLAYMKAGQPGVQASLAPIWDGAVAPEKQWVPIVREPYFASLHFSPGGRTVYFFSTRDDYRCLWARTVLDAAAGIGDALPIHHFHTAKHYPWNGSWLAVGKDRIAMTLSDIVSNVWSATPRASVSN